VIYQQNGLSSNQVFGLASKVINSVVYGNTWVAGGRDSDTSAVIWSSPDGTTWDPNSPVVTGPYLIKSIAYGNLWLAGGNGIMISSADGITWNTGSPVFESLDVDIKSIAYGDSVWLAGGTLTDALVSVGAIWTSTDGITWDPDSSVFQASGGDIRSIAYGDSLWVAGGSYNGLGAIWTSTDGYNWSGTVTFSNAVAIKTIAYGNSLWLAGSTDASGGAIWKSTDGTTWNPTPVLEAETINSIVYGNSLWIAGGKDVTGAIWTSTDGDTWTKVSTSGTEIYSVATSKTYSETAGIIPVRSSAPTTYLPKLWWNGTELKFTDPTGITKNITLT
jgi:hypothetical protein